MNVPFLKKHHQEKISNAVRKLKAHPFLKAEFQPHRVRSLFKRFEFAWVGLLILAVGSLAFRFAPFTQAEVSTFYPGSCLGGWENPGNASGLPSLSLDNAIVSDFTKDNSAYLSGGAQIYCGDFKGEIPEKSIPKKFTLRISWSVDDGNVIHNDPVPVTQDPNMEVSSENEDQPQSIEMQDLSETLEIIKSTIDIPNILPESIVSQTSAEEIHEENAPATELESELAQPDPEPESTPPTPSESPAEAPAEASVQSMLYDLFAKKVFAQDVAEVAEEVSQVSTDDASVLEDKKEISAPSEEKAPEEQDTQIAETDEMKVEDAPSDVLESAQEESMMPNFTYEDKPNGFMEVLYTLDGKEWKSLGVVSRNDWHNVSFDIPISEWTDLSKLQVSLKPLLNIDPFPVVYLDALILDVSYESDSDIISEVEQPFKIVDILNQDQNVNISLKGGMVNLVQIVISTPLLELGNISIFNAETQKIVLNTWTDESQYVADPSYLGVGKYVVVMTKDPDSCSSISFDECLNGPDAISSSSFSIISNVIDLSNSSDTVQEDVPIFEPENIPVDVPVSDIEIIDPKNIDTFTSGIPVIDTPTDVIPAIDSSTDSAQDISVQSNTAQ